MLSEHDHSILREAVDRVYQARLATITGLQNKSAALYDLAQSITDSVRTTLAAALREQNRLAATAHSQLPLELWGAIWSHLSLSNSVTISHVSHDWREAALSSAALWRAPTFVSSTHGDTCDCRSCRDAQLGLPCGKCGRSFRRQDHEPQRAEVFLSRSAQMPLDLRVRLRPRASPATNDALAEHVSAAAGRIEHLDLQADNLASLHKFLTWFSRFPSLRTLSLSHSADEMAELLVTDTLEFPILTSLTLEGQLTLHRGVNAAVSCPAVSTLTGAFTNIHHVRALLLACPVTQNLTLLVGSKTVSHIEEHDDVDKLREQMARAGLQTVHVSRAYDVDLAQILTMFAGARLVRFGIDMHSSSDMRASSLQQLFREVEDPTEFECFVIKGGLTRLTLRAPNAAVTERCITLALYQGDTRSETILRDIWDDVLPPCSTDTLTSVRIDSGFWPLIFSKPGAVAAATATVVFNSSQRTISMDEWFRDCDTGRIESGSGRILPHLTDLVLSATDGDVTLDLGELTASTILGALGVTSKLKKLRLEGIEVIGDISMLQAGVADLVEMHGRL